MPNGIRRGWKGAYLVLAALTLWMALSRLGAISLTTDELLEYQGVVDHVRFARQVVQGGKPDLHSEIVYNLENYGILAKLPAYGISRLLGVADPANYEALVRNAIPYQRYFQISHLITILMGLASTAVLIVVAMAMRMRLAWAAGLILLLTPRFMGDSLFNIKDIPFAFFYLLYSTSLFFRLLSPPSDPSRAQARLVLFSALGAGLMGSMKIVALVPVLIAETLVALIQPKRCHWLDGLHIGIDALLLSLVFTPSSWLEPLRFLNSAVKLFRAHDWPGGTWWHGEFLSRVQDPLHWSTAGYLLRWIPSVTPLWILLLAMVGAASLLRSWLRGAGRDRDALGPVSQAAQPLLWLPFLLQLLLLPGLAVLGNANLYDGVRHVLFIYPPLALLAALGLDRLWGLAGDHGHATAVRSSLIALALMATLTLVDGLTLFPYAYVYVNEPMRFFLSPANTAYDYYVYAGTDAARAALDVVSASSSAPPGCLARVELPDPVKAMLSPSLGAAACAPPPIPSAALPKGDPLALRLESGARAERPSCRSVTRWQWPWFRRALASACLEPLPALPPS